MIESMFASFAQFSLVYDMMLKNSSFGLRCSPLGGSAGKNVSGWSDGEESRFKAQSGTLIHFYSLLE